MYVDKKHRRWPLALFLAVVLFVAAGLSSWAMRASDRNLGEESAAALRDAVRRSAMQCYAVEGVFPPTLEYLEENYGLQINQEDFYVIYDIFASNLPPDIRVVAKQ